MICFAYIWVYVSEGGLHKQLIWAKNASFQDRKPQYFKQMVYFKVIKKKSLTGKKIRKHLDLFQVYSVQIQDIVLYLFSYWLGKKTKLDKNI